MAEPEMFKRDEEDGRRIPHNYKNRRSKSAPDLSSAHLFLLQALMEEINETNRQLRIGLELERQGFQHKAERDALRAKAIRK